MIWVDLKARNLINLFISVCSIFLSSISKNLTAEVFKNDFWNCCCGVLKQFQKCQLKGNNLIATKWNKIFFALIPIDSMHFPWCPCKRFDTLPSVKTTDIIKCWLNLLGLEWLNSCEYKYKIISIENCFIQDFKRFSSLSYIQEFW